MPSSTLRVVPRRQIAARAALRALRVLAASCALAFLATSSIARADAVPSDYEPPECAPSDCPAGTSPFGLVGHGSCGRGCNLPRECGPADACDPGSACGDSRLCVIRNLNQGRMIVDTVVGTCAADGTCAEGECVIARRCLSTAPRVTASSRSGGGCAGCALGVDPRRNGTRGALGVVLALALVAVIAARSRSRGRRATRRAA